MSSFSQWFVSYQKNQTIKQVTWLCGTEPVLIDDILETYRTHFDEDPWCYSSYTAGDDPDKDIWADIASHPVDGKTPRLVVVRSAEKLKHLDRIIDLMQTKNKNPLTHVVFVSNEPEFARHPATIEQRKERKKGDLLPHLKVIQGKGAMIECRPFTQATAKHAVSWVQTKVSIRRGVAGKLLERANGDLRLTRDAFKKLSVFPDEITEQTVNLLLSARPRLDFVDALIEIDKRAALLALDYMPPADYSAAIGLLDQRLEVLGRVRDMVLSHQPMSKISSALGNMGFLTKELVPVSKMYDSKRRDSSRLLLAKVDEALRAGVTKGPMEVLVHFW